VGEQHHDSSTAHSGEADLAGEARGRRSHRGIEHKGSIVTSAYVADQVLPVSGGLQGGVLT
jgi:hypothetical protein